LFSAAWIFVTFLPYSFLTYMPRIPSRHTYLASAGLAWVVAAGFLAFRRRFRPGRALEIVIVAVVVIHNCGYLWTRKRAQYLERAAPTEALVQLARQTGGRIHVRCFPYGEEIARLAVQLGAGRPPETLVWASAHSRFSGACLAHEPVAPAPRVIPASAVPPESHSALLEAAISR
jgi:hypothetical protein